MLQNLYINYFCRTQKINLIMKNYILPLYSWGNGAFIMVVVFSLVILGLVGGVYLLMNTDKKKKEKD